MSRILVVDDDENICAAFRRFLERLGHDTLVASNARDALKVAAESEPDVVVMDVRMPGLDGLGALERLRQADPDALVIIMTAYGTSQTSIEAMRLGAYDCVSKPLDLDVLRSVLDRALEARALRLQLGASTAGAPGVSLTDLAGRSSAMQEIYKIIGILATHDLPVLLVGERGTGKELVARTIHRNSRRREAPFLAVPCQGLDEQQAAAELFGAAGALATADGGTLFVHDLANLPLRTQGMLARYLEDGSVPVPGGVPRPGPDARVMAATLVNPRAAGPAGAFSAALLDRLDVVPVVLPPLRDRREDIRDLAIHFLDRLRAELGGRVRGIDERALRLLEEQDWPGNVGELANALKRACVLARTDVITVEEIRAAVEPGPQRPRNEIEAALRESVRATLRRWLEEPERSPSGSAYHDIVEEVERTLVEEALARTGGNQVKAAELLQVNRTTLRKRIRGG
jgi:two-component system nitrogen regulation response regulator GlnG